MRRLAPKEGVPPMYGTIARLHPRPGKADELLKLGDSMRAVPMAG